jgi:hypothetical protein
MGKSKSYFTIKELTYSATAKKYKIDNTPNKEETEHLNELIDFLNPVRVAWGSALLVSSGFRCEMLNEKVGGAKTSGHKYGYAVDLIPANNKKLQFFEFMKEYLKDKAFDELIFETNSNGATWVHFALKGKDGKQRKKIKMLEVK